MFGSRVRVLAFIFVAATVLPALAEVRVVKEDTNVASETQSSSERLDRVTALVPGHSQIEAHFPGFQTDVRLPGDFERASGADGAARRAAELSVQARPLIGRPPSSGPPIG
jgi:hypothetical protein